MQSFLTRRSREQRVSGGEFCEVISTLTHELTKARNQLVRLMHQVKPGGPRRLYGGYSVPYEPLRKHTPYAGSSVRNRHRTPAPGYIGCGNASPHLESASFRPQRPCQRPMTVHGASRFGQPQQRAPFSCGRPEQKVPKSCEELSHNKVQYSYEKPQVPYSCERQQQCNRSDSSERTDGIGQRDSTCVHITFDSPEPAPPARRPQDSRRPQDCRRDTNTCRGSKPACLQDSCEPARLQGRGSSRRHDCVGTQFATLLEDVTYQLRVCRLAVDFIKIP